MEIIDFATKYRVKRLLAGKPSKYSSRTPIEADYDVCDGRAGYLDTPSPDDSCTGVSALRIDSGDGSDGDGHKNRRRRSDILVLNLIATPRNRACDGLLNNRAKLAEAAGMTLRRRNGAETQWYFDATDEVQSRAAIQIAGCSIKRTRIMTDDQKQALRARLVAGRLAKAESVSV